MRTVSSGKRKAVQLFALFLAGLFVVVSPALGRVEAQAAPQFKVLAFYNGTWDAAHINWVKEANVRFPQIAAQNNFTYTSTTNWNMLNATDLAQYQVVMFLDDAPTGAAQRSAFQQYMANGGGYFGFHVSAYTDNANNWPWFSNTFLGSGAFKSNTWGPTTAVLKVEDQTHPSTKRLPTTFTSAVSEWYSWNNDLRTNPNIKVLASVDPSSFPLGTDPNQQWRSGYYPIMWTNKNYKMLYANFGHNAMNYETNTGLSSTFDSEIQNRFLLDGLLWLGGGSGTTPPDPGGISPTAWYSAANKTSAKCVDARSAATANGTVVQQYTCNATLAQQYQFAPTSGGYVRINNRGNAAQVVDVSNTSTADNAGLHLWAYGGGNNQQWLPVAETDGGYHFVSRLSSKCLTVPGASTADSVQLVQLTCDGSASQSFRLTQQG
ncbi:ThuA domain-containing protein [Umezawaea sp. Da 62-37]|uniref:ThuA domain-containing protein n=1 Tax=Umezawaea sp. Da 62-37 TaxID=3075927 RepID=UPI0028F6E7A3|nr:ThuA domain-containing protein [Umezawaea sp. Da 62-37]WNV88569.1 ThuA domain-containing protein [Umezawaea sp. Da 62-37]